MTILHSYSASYITSALNSSTVPSTSLPIPRATYYKIDNVRKAENASLFFTRNAKSNEHVVMKILNNYKDIRYSLETVRKRQFCQLDALQWNRRLTKDVYLGLAQVVDPNVRKQICIGEIIENPTLEELDPNAEYALLMEELPGERRLDQLLKRDNVLSNKYYASVLARYMAAMYHIYGEHEAPSLASSEGERWGSVKQLEEKLRHNFDFVDVPTIEHKAILHSEAFKALKDFSSLLKARLLPLFAIKQYQEYFEERIKDGRIRRCHGDLKSRNIWIMPFDVQSDEELWGRVKVLDAVDFNPMYSTIDILSDFAMLVVDVHMRTDSYEIANGLLEDYLRLTKQEGKSTHAVSNYYMVEKAFIGAIVNIIYDEKPDYGLAYLKVAKRRLEDVKLSR